MKGSGHPSNDLTLNPSGNESIRDVLDRIDESRRHFVKTAVSSTALAAIGGVTAGSLVETVEAAPIPAGGGFAGIGFESIPPSLAPVADRITVPPGYKVEVLAAWGDPITPLGANWLDDASQDAAAQEQQYGMHNDGMHYFPFPTAGGNGQSSERGLLCVNHEYTHEAILHTDGLDASTGIPSSLLTIQKIRKSQAANGVSVMEIRRTGGKWGVNRMSPFGRRITINTPVSISGPAAGHALMQTVKYNITPTGSVANGTSNGREGVGIANLCAHGFTPWGTYLTCEENWNGYFGTAASFTATKLERRYGVSKDGFGYKWHDRDDRFDVRKNPNETNNFGWVVEIDPFDPKSVPVKRTALGRFKHESAQVAVGPDNAVAYYMGDDERNEYIYKFVCAQAWNPRNRKANMNLLDQGTLYVAKFTSTVVAGKSNTFRGQWIALVPGTIGLDGKALRENPEFAAATDAEVQALILIKTRMAGDAVGATMMDRPEWTALRTYSTGNRPGSLYSYGPNMPLEVYCTLTNNSRRGNTPVSSNNPNGSTGAASANPPVDVANPRPDNDYGHIIRWREDGNTCKALGFEWDIFVQCGDKATTKTLGGSYTAAGHDGYKGNINGADFGAPDGLWFDHFGRMWIQTDQPGNATGDWVNIGSNTMLCADPNTKEIRRFLTSPPNCEVTGVVSTPDGRTMFCGIQHPGEDSPANNPAQFSNWPQSQWATNSAGQPLPNTPGKSRPRSSVLVITREDGGIVGGL
jgi:secreted PhoX family phosphatase